MGFIMSCELKLLKFPIKDDQEMMQNRADSIMDYMEKTGDPFPLMHLLTEMFNYYSNFDEDFYCNQIQVKLNELINNLDTFYND